MLVSFSISNFMSIGSKQTISMVPSLQKSKGTHLITIQEMTLLKHAVIFGANSSGKSNFIKAMALGKQIIMEGISSKFKHAYSKLGQDDNPRITTWEYTFYIDNHFFTYGFSANLNTNHIDEEWLLEINPKSDRSKFIFERDVQKQELICNLKTDKSSQKRLLTYINDVKENSQVLFLSEINHHKHLDNELQVFLLAYQWFEKHLQIRIDESPSEKTGFFDEQYQKQFLNVISEFDTGIEGISLQSLSWDSFQEQISPQLLNEIRQLELGNFHKFSLRLNNQLYSFQMNDDHHFEVFLVLFKHQSTPFMFSFNEQSEGTKRIIELVDLLINAKPNTTYVWDELDRSIHPLLTGKYLEKYLEMSEKNNTQLIFSTHETNILSQNRLRRDEVWFMEKGTDQSSKLYSLDIFKERLDKKLSTSYLEGQYGGIPNINIKDEQ
ncbi:MAG: ATP/GTP-binding protein [Bacilli bacterium]